MTKPSNQTPSPVSLSPTTFTDPSIADYTAGEVVRTYHTQEAKRKRDEGEESQRDVAVFFRSAPEGLLPSLRAISTATGLSRAIVTKCLSHHVMAWYQSMPQVGELVSLFDSVYLRSDGHPDIARLLERSSYEFGRPAVSTVHGSIRSVSFVTGYLSDISVPLGIPVYYLFLSGLCWSVSTNVEGWSESSVKQYLIPERDHMLDYLAERVLLFQYVDSLLRWRRGELDIEEYVADFRGRMDGEKKGSGKNERQ